MFIKPKSYYFVLLSNACSSTVSLFLTACICVYLSAYLCVSVLLYVCVYLSVCPSVQLSVFICVRVFVDLCLCVCSCVCLYLSANLSICACLSVSPCLLGQRRYSRAWQCCGPQQRGAPHRLERKQPRAGGHSGHSRCGRLRCGGRGRGR